MSAKATKAYSLYLMNINLPEISQVGLGAESESFNMVPQTATRDTLYTPKLRDSKPPLKLIYD